MGTLYDELLASLTKQASSTEDTIKQGVADLDNNELLVLASELAELTGDSELAEMAKLLPVYGSGQVDKDIQTEQVINNAEPEVKPEEEVVVEAAEGDEDEEKSGDDEDTKDEEEKEDDDTPAEEDKKDDEEEAEEDGQEATAAETLYELLKEGAALEELIEIRAAQMVDALAKEAEDAEIARGILDQAATALSTNAMKAYEYSQLMMDKAKTVAGAKAVNLVDAAKSVAADVLTTAKAIVPGAGILGKAASYDRLAELSKQATELEDSYEKLAEDINMIAEQTLVAAGEAQGLVGTALHDFVQKGLDNVRTLAAKKDINIAQAAQEFLAGETGAITGVEEPSVPSESVAPSPGKAQTINANVTQSPDQLIPAMIASIEPNPEGSTVGDVPAAAPEAPAAAPADQEVKEAAAKMLLDLFKQAGVNFNQATSGLANAGSEKLATAGEVLDKLTESAKAFGGSAVDAVKSLKDKAADAAAGVTLDDVANAAPLAAPVAVGAAAGSIAGARTVKKALKKSAKVDSLLSVIKEAIVNNIDKAE